MKRYGEKHPVLFEILLTIAAFIAASALTAVGNILYLHSALSTSLARIITGVILLLIWKEIWKRKDAGGSAMIAVPALLFAAWNIFYNLSSGNSFGGLPFFVEALVTAIAPALFEEVLFRGIFLNNLKKKGHGDLACVLISAAIFALVHLTNAVGMDMTSVLLQVGYSFVVGLVLAAVYLKNGSLLLIMAVHFLIDFTNRLYVNEVTSASTAQMVIFAVLLAAEAVYALLLTAGRIGKTGE